MALNARITCTIVSYQIASGLPLKHDGYVVEWDCVTGLALNRYAEDGMFLDAELELSGVLAIEDVPEDVKSAMKTMTGILANAKAEVRSAVLNLRGEGGLSQSLEESISGMVAALKKTGVNARKMLRGLPASMPEGMPADIVLIMREAVTNAVKHHPDPSLQC